MINDFTTYTNFTELSNNIKEMEHHIMVLLYAILGTVFFVSTFFFTCLYIQISKAEKRYNKLEDNLLQYEEKTDEENVNKEN